MDAKDKQIATDLAYEIIREVSRAIRPYVGKPESGEKIKIGADGTPTSLIDIIAEDKLAFARVRAKEVRGETRRTRTGSGYKAFSRASQPWMAKPQP